MQSAAQVPTALPLGQNCHLGAALTRFSFHESSLFRWAEIAMPTLLAFLEGDRAEPFAGRTEFRLVGTAFGTLSHAAMRARLAEAPGTARINTIVYDREGEAYAHGVQLSRAEAADWTYAEISAANAAKIKHLQYKWISDLAGGTPVAIRLEWAPIARTEDHARLFAALRRVNRAVELKVVGPSGSVEGEREGAQFFALRSPLPPLSDVMNVGATEAEWRSLFGQWGLAPRGAPPRYFFDV